MLYLAIKAAISALVVVSVSEISRRSTAFGAIVASLPLTTLQAMIWMHHEGASGDKIGDLSRSIAWLLVPSIVFLILVPVLLKQGWAFYSTLALSAGATAVVYGVFTRVIGLG